jgi:hypothetical protein
MNPIGLKLSYYIANITNMDLKNINHNGDTVVASNLDNINYIYY